MLLKFKIFKHNFFVSSCRFPYQKGTTFKENDKGCHGNYFRVLLAYHKQSRKQWALKVVRKSSSSVWEKTISLKNEAKLMRLVEHPNVVKVIDFNKIKNANLFFNLILMLIPTTQLQLLVLRRYDTWL